MAQQTSALYEPMTGPLNIHPPTHPHLLRVIQQGLTHRQTQPQAHTHTQILCCVINYWPCTANPSSETERETNKKKKIQHGHRQTDRQRPKDRESRHGEDVFGDTEIKFLIFWLVMWNCDSITKTAAFAFCVSQTNSLILTAIDQPCVN